MYTYSVYIYILYTVCVYTIIYKALQSLLFWCVSLVFLKGAWSRGWETLKQQNQSQDSCQETNGSSILFFHHPTILFDDVLVFRKMPLIFLVK